MKTVDVTFQNLDSSEISLTDVSHYFDSDPTKLVAGLRNDGRTPSAFIADTTTANAQVCPISWCQESVLGLFSGSAIVLIGGALPAHAAATLAWMQAVLQVQCS